MTFNIVYMRFKELFYHLHYQHLHNSLRYAVKDTFESIIIFLSSVKKTTASGLTLFPVLVL